MDSLEIVSSNEWQDCYRIVGGYLFIVNKFVRAEYMGTTYKIPRNYYKKVGSNVKGKLWILTRPVKRYGGYSENGLLEPYEENGEFPVGTVFYNEEPVEITENIYRFEFIVKAAWNNMCGSFRYLENIANKTKQIVDIYTEKYQEQIEKMNKSDF